MKFKFKNLIAFTLSEMMIVLLIVSVISAATIPTITQQKQKKYNVSEGSVSATALWQKDNFGGIFSNLAVSDNTQTVAIGADTSNTTNFTSSTKANYKASFGNSNIALLLNRNATGPQMTLYDKDGYTGSIKFFNEENILMQSLPKGTLHNTAAGNTINVIGIGTYAGLGSMQVLNVAIGNYASNISNGFGVWNQNYHNVSIGSYSTRNGFYTKYGVAVGYCALSNACKGPIQNSYVGIPSSVYMRFDYNVALGANSGRLNYTEWRSHTADKDNNISLGYYAGNYAYGNTYNNSTHAFDNNFVSDSIAIGAYSGLSNVYANNIDVGYFAGGYASFANPAPYYFSEGKRENNINIGHYAGAISLDSIAKDVDTYGYNVSIGNYASYNLAGVTQGVMIGPFAAYSVQERGPGGWGPSKPNPVVAIGYYAMYGSSMGNGFRHLGAIGAYAASQSNVVFDSVYIGRYAGYKANSTKTNKSYPAQSNIYIGHYAGANSDMLASIAIGNYAGQSTSGTNNTFIGYAAGTFGTSHVTGSNKYIILPYTSSTVLTDTGSKFSLTNDTPQMIIGPGYGYPNGPTGFSYTTLLLYAQNIYARQTTLTSFTSDRRLKENIVPAKYGINEIRHLNTYTYNFKSDATKARKVGLIAQEVQKVMPEAVMKGFYSNKLTINFDWILFSLANAIKQVDATLLSMKNDLKIQVKQLTSLEKRVDKLENKTRVMFEKQDKMQAKLNDTKGILERMETK